jgi:hypothetical protein
MVSRKGAKENAKGTKAVQFPRRYFKPNNYQRTTQPSNPKTRNHQQPTLPPPALLFLLSVLSSPPMSKELTKREDDYSQWYNEFVIKESTGGL